VITLHYDSLKPQEKNHGVSPAINIHGKAEYPWLQTYALYLMGSAGIVYYELLQPNETIIGDRFHLQLMRSIEPSIEKKNNRNASKDTTK